MSAPKIQNVYCVVGDMDRAQRFYESTLGLSLKFRDGSQWAQFSLANTHFALSSASEAPASARGFVAVFELADVDGARERIEQAGGRFLEERDMGTHGRVLTFSDPDSNVFQLYCKAAAL